MVVALLVLTSCKGGVQLGAGTTTTTVTTATTAAPPRTVVKQVRKTPTTTTTIAPPAELDLTTFQADPSKLQPLLIDPGSEWTQQTNDGAGAFDLERAIASEVALETGDYDNVSNSLRSKGFLAGYEGQWEKLSAPDDTPALEAGFFLFQNTTGASAYLAYTEARFAVTTLGTIERISVDEIPVSRAWTADDEHASVTVVLFIRGNFFGYVLCTSGGFDHRAIAAEFAKQQYDRLIL